MMRIGRLGNSSGVCAAAPAMETTATLASAAHSVRLFMAFLPLSASRHAMAGGAPGLFVLRFSGSCCHRRPPPPPGSRLFAESRACLSDPVDASYSESEVPGNLGASGQSPDPPFARWRRRAGMKKASRCRGSPDEMNWILRRLHLRDLGGLVAGGVARPLSGCPAERRPVSRRD